MFHRAGSDDKAPSLLRHETRRMHAVLAPACLLTTHEKQAPPPLSRMRFHRWRGRPDHKGTPQSGLPGASVDDTPVATASSSRLVMKSQLCIKNTVF